MSFNINSSQGKSHTFNSSFSVEQTELRGQKPFKYIRLTEIGSNPMAFDDAIIKTSDKFREEVYSFLFNNSYSFVADVLNLVNYAGSSSHTAFSVILMTIGRGKYVSWLSFLKNYFFTFAALSLCVGIYIFK